MKRLACAAVILVVGFLALYGSLCTLGLIIEWYRTWNQSQTRFSSLGIAYCEAIAPLIWADLVLGCALAWHFSGSVLEWVKERKSRVTDPEER